MVYDSGAIVKSLLPARGMCQNKREGFIDRYAWKLKPDTTHCLLCFFAMLECYFFKCIADLIKIRWPTDAYQNF